MTARANGVDLDRARSALAAIDAGCARDQWVRVAMASRAAGLGLDDFVRWSSSGANFDSARDCAAVWRSIKADGGVTAGTLFRAALEAGWRDDAEHRARPIRPRAVPRFGSAAAKFAWRELWESAEPATAEHQYIERKLGSADGLRVYRGPARIAGRSIDGALLVPGHGAGGALQTWQAISADGTKLTAPGTRIAGAFFVVGGPPRDGAPVYVTEGIGAAWSAHQATRAPAVATFGSGNVRGVAESIHAAHPNSQIVVVADLGREQDSEQIARAVGGSWVALPDEWPANSDINDVHTRDGLGAVAALLAQAREPAGPFAWVSLADLDENPPPAREWVLQDWLPRGSVTALFGQGGAGKSLLAQQLITAAACGDHFLGIPTARGPAIGLFCEDDVDEIRRRQVQILAAAGRSSRFSTGDLLIESRVGLDNTLVAFGPDRLAEPTRLFSDLLETVKRIRPSIVVVDNSAQVYAGPENERGPVTAFLNLLGRIAIEAHCAVLLLGHVAKATGSEYSGSTAWEAAIRTRLWLERRDDGLLTLHRRKANYSGQDALTLEWRDGAFAKVEASGASGTEAVAARSRLLEALDTYAKRQVATSHNPTARNNLVLMALRDRLLDGISRQSAAAALAALVDAGEVLPNVDLPWRKPDRKQARGLARRPI